MAAGAEQLLRQTNWRDLDYLIDATEHRRHPADAQPAGAHHRGGDRHHAAGHLLDARKGIKMFEGGVPILGIVEPWRCTSAASAAMPTHFRADGRQKNGGEYKMGSQRAQDIKIATAGHCGRPPVVIRPDGVAALYKGRSSQRLAITAWRPSPGLLRKFLQSRSARTPETPAASVTDVP
jgi:ATP-binding protein involved in chromosome partitioning